MNKQTETAPRNEGRSPATDPAFPSAPEFRTTAKVIRFICDELDTIEQQMPLLERVWWKLTRENNDELRRKSAVIESIADALEEPNQP